MADESVIPFKSERDIAGEHRAKVEAILRDICAAMDAARSDGMTINFNIGQDAFGRNVVQTLAVTKVLA